MSSREPLRLLHLEAPDLGRSLAVETTEFRSHSTRASAVACGCSGCGRWPQFGKDHKFRAVNAVGHLHRQRIRNGVVLIAGQDQRRTLDPRQRRPRVRPAMTAVCWRTKASAPTSSPMSWTSWRKLASSRRDGCTKPRNNSSSTARSRRFTRAHQTAAAGGRLRRIRPRLGVDQRQFCHPLRRLPHDLERDIAAHRMSRQREARRRLGQDPARNRAHTVVADVVGDRHRAKTPQRRDDGCENPRRARPAPERARSASYCPCCGSGSGKIS